jgi:hypothetical protein
LWGRDCVVIHLKNGSVLRIDTDDAPTWPASSKRRSVRSGSDPEAFDSEAVHKELATGQ